MNEGLLIVRLVFGLMMAGHGAQKLFGWFGGYGIARTGSFFETIGFRPGRPMAAAAGFGEFASGVLVAVGLLGPAGPALMLAVMIVASSVHWQNGLFATANGVELALLFAAAATGLALTGYGAYSLDAALGLSSFWTSGIAWASLVAGIAAGVVVLAARRAPATAKATA
jgi:putative oxidoreductase